MNTVKKRITCIVITLLLCSSMYVYADQSFDDELLSFLNQADCSIESVQATRALDCPTPQEIIELLTGIQLPEILSNDIYLYTNPINVRNIIDTPILGFKRDSLRCSVASIDFFYNQMRKAYFTCNSPFLDSYIALTDPALLADLKRLNDLFPDADIAELLAMFGVLKLEERKAGIMGYLHHENDQWVTRWKTPLYYMEHNFFLTDEEQKLIENSTFFTANDAINPQSGRDEAEQFGRQHLVSDKVGVGDSRFGTLYKFCWQEDLQIAAGLEFTIPTAFTIKRGLLGGRFSKCCPLPIFSLQEVIDLFLCEGPEQRNNRRKGLEQALAFLTSALDRLTANLADTPLGNGHHFGIAPVVEIYSKYNDCFSFWFYGAIEYLAPANESRYFIRKKNKAEFNRDYDNPDDAETNLAFLNEQLIETLNPFCVSTCVRPGVLVKLRPMIEWDLSKYNLFVGYDFWWQGKEKFVKFHCDPAFINTRALQKGYKPKALQQKLFAELWAHCYATSAVEVKLFVKGDYTFANKGIGKDFTLAFGVQAGL